MKLAIINEPWNGGATRCALDLARGFAEEHEVWYCPDESTPRHGDVLSRLDEFRPDVVHLHSFYGWLHYQTLLKISARYPTVFTPHDPRPIGQIELPCWDCERNRTCFSCPLVPTWKRYSLVKHRYFQQRLKRRWVHSRCPESLVVVGVSEWFTERLRKQELSRFRLEHIPNGIDTEVFRPIPDARERLGLDPQEKIVLFLSSPAEGWEVNERKGLIPLAEAFLDQVVPREPDAVLVVAGDRLVPNHPKVRGIGYVAKEDLPLWYSAAAVYVLPSQGDNLPYTVLEAMACGCPVVATAVGGIPEMVEDGETGYLVDTCDPMELGGALLKCLGAQRPRPMAQKAREKAINKYTLAAFLNRHRDLYERMIIDR